jgi:hypothetical protein
MKKLILFLIIITAITAGCKKYPDGPLISFRTAKSRLYGTHILKRCTIDGTNSLSLYCDSVSTRFDFYYDSNSGVNYCMIRDQLLAGMSGNGTSVNSLFWSWDLENHNKNLKVISSQGNNGFGPFKNNVLPDWEILKLKADDIIMQTTYNNKQYLIELTGD